MKFSNIVSLVLLSATIMAVQPQIATALTALEVNAIAKQITVRIDGAKPGSGVIIKQQGNTYTVLTNWHVLEARGTYTIQTHNEKRYPVNPSSIKRISSLDLAELQFTSATNETYRVAELGDSSKISEGTQIYAAGWTTSNNICLEERCYLFTNGQIYSILSKTKAGYGLVYSNVIKSGMSGGSLLDEQGRLVGINGIAKPDIITGTTDFLGISINTYLNSSSDIGNFSVENKFYCGRGKQGDLFTFAKSPKGRMPFIRWISDRGSNSKAEKFCQEASANFQSQYENGTLRFLTNGTLKGKPAICAVANSYDSCTDKNVLFTLKPGTDTKKIIEKLMRAGSLAGGITEVHI